ncbi:glycoside hydrolase family 16 protein [Candidatus Villigracilis saccharophilus]|uniref:glycoside hydrolase family 16 protein n=1 Tax=Candidatus Villigracilis saccharophilus TaxID=3140684 RepID=UPI003136DFB2|nr:glycoside hydrolase family 16 protein [Anaerolineales bacterium]
MSNRFLSKAILALIVTVVCVSCGVTPTATPIAPPPGWELKWHDEFDGKEINASNWTYDLGAGGWGNGEAQNYTARPENARVENGMLVIEARQEKFEDSYYTSARLKTQGLQDFQYGRIEARLKVPSGKGLWPAFWMLGSEFNGGNWPDCGEIDVMEHLGKEPDLIFGTIHGPGYSGALGLTKWNRQAYNIADDFHTYAIEWEADQVNWIYDGTKYFTVTRADVGERDWVFNQKFFIILNLAVGGNFPGPIGLDVVFPKQLLVDYVRVYQKLP